MTDLPPNAVTEPVMFFPERFVQDIAKSLQDLLPDCVVAPRPLSSEDPSFSVGVFADSWAADEESYEIGQFEPTRNVYVIRVQSMIKSLEHTAGRQAHANLAKAIRVILYRDSELQLRLRSSNEEMMSSIERVDGFAVTRTEFLSGRVGASFMFMATTYTRITTNTTFQN